MGHDDVVTVGSTGQAAEELIELRQLNIAGWVDFDLAGKQVD